MRYLQILHTAKRLTFKNPIFWLFGLVLYGGFNLYSINFFTLFSRGQWKFLILEPRNIVLLTLGGLVLFIVLNVIKIIFIVQAHNTLHNIEDQTCDLCVKVKAEKLNYGEWIKSVLLASGLTIVISGAVTLTASYLIYGFAPDSIPAVIINILLILVLTSAVGIWNLFTSYFIIMHGANFSNASKLSLDLITLRLRNLVEFGFILAALYSLSVFVGNAFIIIGHEGIGPFHDPATKVISLAVFVIWFAVNNTFFNLTFIVFFDRLVKSNPAAKDLGDRQLHPNVLN